jgi:hypothetical protein
VTEPLREPAELEGVELALIESFGLHETQLETALAAFREAPRGLIVVALDSRKIGAARGNTGAGLLMHRIRRGDHYDEELALEPPKPKRTGWRRVRGSHGETWLQDPQGTDVLPRDY